MTPQEHIEYLFNNCIEIDDKYYYNELYIRECKINSLLNIDKPKFNIENSIVLFEKDYERNYFWYSLQEIYLDFEHRYNLGFREINDLVENMLNEYNKLEPSYVNKLLYNDMRVFWKLFY